MISTKFQWLLSDVFPIIKNPFLVGHLFVFFFVLGGVRYTSPKDLSRPLPRIDGRNYRAWWETSNSYSLPTEPPLNLRGSPCPSHQEWDKDKDGRLDYREFAAIFQYLGRCSQDAMWCEVYKDPAKEGFCSKHLADVWIYCRHKSRGWFSFNLMTMWVQWSIIFATWKWSIPLTNKVIDHFGWSIGNTLVLPEVCRVTVALNW